MYSILTVSFQISYFCKQANVTEDNNHAIIYEMATVYRSYCQMEWFFPRKNQHSNIER